MAVYMLQAGEGGPVKIGYATKLAKRLRSLGVHSSNQTVLLRTAPGGEVEEGYFHHRFAAQRLHGEWFSFDPAMLTAEPPALPERLVGHGFAPMSIAIGIQQLGGTKAAAELFGIQPIGVTQWIGHGQIPLCRHHQWYALAVERGIELPNRIFWSMYHPRAEGQPLAESPFERRRAYRIRAKRAA